MFDTVPAPLPPLDMHDGSARFGLTEQRSLLPSWPRQVLLHADGVPTNEAAKAALGYLLAVLQGSGSGAVRVWERAATGVVVVGAGGRVGSGTGGGAGTSATGAAAVVDSLPRTTLARWPALHCGILANVVMAAVRLHVPIPRLSSPHVSSSTCAFQHLHVPVE